jgi:hypothetical protein
MIRASTSKFPVNVEHLSFGISPPERHCIGLCLRACCGHHGLVQGPARRGTQRVSLGLHFFLLHVLATCATLNPPHQQHDRRQLWMVGVGIARDSHMGPAKVDSFERRRQGRGGGGQRHAGAKRCSRRCVRGSTERGRCQCRRKTLLQPL